MKGVEVAAYYREMKNFFEAGKNGVERWQEVQNIEYRVWRDAWSEDGIHKKDDEEIFGCRGLSNIVLRIAAKRSQDLDK